MADEKLSQGSIDDLIAQLLAGGGGSGPSDGPAYGDDGPIAVDEASADASSPEANAA